MNWNSARQLARPRSWVGMLCGFAIAIMPGLVFLMVERGEPLGDRDVLRYAMPGVFVFGLLLLRRYGANWIPYARLTPLLYLGSFILLWASKPTWGHPLTHLGYGILLLVPMGLIAVQELLSSGSASVRKSRFLVDAIVKRTEWPEPEEVRRIPEALALRETLQDDPAPALALLGHPRLEVQLAALSALQYRPKWKRQHAQILLQTASSSPQPLVRGAALTALANVDDPLMVNAMVPYLRDPSMEVRRAAAGSLLWKPDRRWAAIRHGLRGNLNDPKCARDGAFPCLTTLPLQALTDLTVWSGEIGSVGQRSTLTLIQYYRRALGEDRTPTLGAHLAQQLVLSTVPAAVRVEIGHLLREQGMIDTPTAFTLLEEHQPGPLRIIAADVILSERKDERAIDVLKELARQPNRELSLAAAIVIQKALRVDLGLPLGEAPPAPSSKQAAEIVRRVMQWAVQHDRLPKKDEESIDFDLPTGRVASRL